MSTGSPWPSATDYVAAMQHPRLVFRKPALQAATFEVDMLGLPDAATGSNAVVFKARVAGIDTAVRCFTSEAGRSRDRYETLVQHRQSFNLSNVAEARWTDEAITVKRHVWPVVQMEWVQGRTLDEYVRFLCDQQPDSLGELADEWLALLEQLSSGRMAHGDLQHGNVLVDSAARLRLVDLDGVWVSTSNATQPPDEYGHPCYRHPQHVGPAHWGPYMDTFPGLLIYMTLLVLREKPELWRQYNNGSNLLFVADDLRRPQRTPLWTDIKQSRQVEVRQLNDLLAACCAQDWRPGGTVHDLITSVQVTQTVPVTPSPDVDLWDMTPAHSQVVGSAAHGGSGLPAPPPPEAHHATVSAPTPGGAAALSSWWSDGAAGQRVTRPPSAAPVHAPRAARPAKKSTTARDSAIAAAIALVGVLFLILVLMTR